AVASATGGSDHPVMDRRAFIGRMGGSILAAPLAAEAQQAGEVYPLRLIAAAPPVLEAAGPEPCSPNSRALMAGCLDPGAGEGQNLILERRSAESRYERFGDIVAELVRLKADVIVTGSTQLAGAAKAVTTTVPIVMAVSVDPVSDGVVQSLARPGGNITGLTS